MKHWTVERHDTVEVWTYRNPPMNYFVGPGAAELLELIGKAEADAELRAIILTGGIDGKFITHYSVDELAQIHWRATSAWRPTVRTRLACPRRCSASCRAAAERSACRASSGGAKRSR